MLWDTKSLCHFHFWVDSLGKDMMILHISSFRTDALRRFTVPLSVIQSTGRKAMSLSRSWKSEAIASVTSPFRISDLLITTLDFHTQISTPTSRPVTVTLAWHHFSVGSPEPAGSRCGRPTRPGSSCGSCRIGSMSGAAGGSTAGGMPPSERYRSG